MKAYKFLAAGATGPFSGFVWPEVAADAEGRGRWVEVEGELAPCSRGVHVCRVEDLAHWVHEELWELEVEGEVRPGVDCLVARRARLSRHVQAWVQGGAARFVDASREHAAALAGSSSDPLVRGLLDDAAESASGGYLALAAFCAARAVMSLAPVGDRELRYRAERAWQSAWIGRELIGA